MVANETVVVSFDAYDDPWYFGVLHLNSVLSLLSSVVAFYFIVARSPSSIGIYKWYLLNISISALLYDIHVSLLYAPQPLLPVLGFCSKGLINEIGWSVGGALPFLVMLVLLGDSSLSVIWGLAYRYSVVNGHVKRLHSKARISFMVLAQALYMAPSVIVFILSAQHREVIRSAIIQKYPGIQQYFLEDSCAALSFDTSHLALAFVIMCIVQFSAVAPSAIVLMTLCFRALKRRQSSMSAKTLRMHRQLLVSLIFQVAVPFITVYVPSTLMALLAMAGVNAPGVYKSLFVIGTLHSFLNTLMMIAHIAPYRNALRDLMRTKRFKNSVFMDSRIQT